MQLFNVKKRKNCIAFTPLEIERSRLRRPRFLKGFTLIEMMTVLVIIGIITAVTLPYFFSFYTGRELKTSARVIASCLRQARSYAAAKNVDYQVVFSVPESNELNISIYYEDPAGTITQVGKTEKLKLSATVEFRDGNDSTFINKSITFSPQGTPNPAGTIRIVNTGKSKRIDVTVLLVTGRVKIKDIEGY